MLGLPFGDSILWRLLLGVAVTLANLSKPRVAFTRSRRMRRAVSGSPLRNSVAASSRSVIERLPLAAASEVHARIDKGGLGGKLVLLPWENV